MFLAARRNKSCHSFKESAAAFRMHKNPAAGTSSLKERGEREEAGVVLHGRKRIGVTSVIPYSLCLYVKHPTEEITLQQFERLAVRRLALLIELDLIQQQTRGNKKFTPVHSTENFMAFEGKDLQTDARSDAIGHHILRLAFCRDPDKRKRLVELETTLFRFRATGCCRDPTAVARFLSVYIPELKAMSGTEFDDATQHILREHSDSGLDLEPSGYYRLKWTEVHDLVARSKVFVRSGFAYVTHRDLVGLFVRRFRDELVTGLNAMCRMTLHYPIDLRIQPIVMRIARSSEMLADQTHKQSAPSGSLLLSEIEAVARSTSMPLCMQHTHRQLIEKKHLKYGGRRQYGLFLKSAGLSMKDSLVFWGERLTLKKEANHKEMKYNILHMYGAVGAGRDQTAQSCARIIEAPSSSASSDDHGCPFRRWTEISLQQRLTSELRKGGLNGAALADGLRDIMTKVTEKRPQMACQTLFRLCHGNIDPDGVGNHPNRYFEVSRKWHRAQSRPVTVSSSSSSPSIRTFAK